MPTDCLNFETSLVRVCYFKPYLPGKGPKFKLRIWDTNRRDSDGKYILSYKLDQMENHKAVTLFEGADFHCAPGFSVDSDGCVESLMGFLTLRPGDTDADYFANYSGHQKQFCEEHAESLSCEVSARFCDENGNLKRAHK